MVRGRNAEPRDLLVVASAAQVRAYLHPVRHRMLQLLGNAALTSSMVAERMGVHPANLTHHFRALLAGKLVRLVEERDTGRVIEKYYRAVARRFEVRPAARKAPAGAAAMALQMLQADLGAAIDSMSEDERCVAVHLRNARIAPEDFGRFVKELGALVARWEKVTRRARRTGRGYSLGLAIYPREPANFGSASPGLNTARKHQELGRKPQ